MANATHQAQTAPTQATPSTAMRHLQEQARELKRVSSEARDDIKGALHMHDALDRELEVLDKQLQGDRAGGFYITDRVVGQGNAGEAINLAQCLTAFIRDGIAHRDEATFQLSNNGSHGAWAVLTVVGLVLNEALEGLEAEQEGGHP